MKQRGLMGILRLFLVDNFLDGVYFIKKYDSANLLGMNFQMYPISLNSTRFFSKLKFLLKKYVGESSDIKETLVMSYEYFHVIRLYVQEIITIVFDC